jgi:DNA mismatch endonuclease (patch repair protein)
VDIKSEKERSRNMAKIRSTNTKPEVFIRSILHKQNYRFRVNYKEIEGSPDLYFTKKKITVFIHGCYWHRHKGCRYAYTPKSNVEFWEAKFEANIKRDKIVIDTLTNQGIRVLIIWECTIKNMQRDEELFNKNLSMINDFLRLDSPSYMEI